MNVPQSELDALRALAGKISGEANGAMISVGRAQTERITSLLHLTAQLTTRLEQAGAQRPKTVALPADVPLHLLDTPKNRRYAEALRVAWEAGLAVDEERYGEKIGTDGCAQMIEMVLADVEQQIGGATGLVRE